MKKNFKCHPKIGQLQSNQLKDAHGKRMNEPHCMHCGSLYALAVADAILDNRASYAHVESGATSCRTQVL